MTSAENTSTAIADALIESFVTQSFSMPGDIAMHTAFSPCLSSWAPKRVYSYSIELPLLYWIVCATPTIAARLASRQTSRRKTIDEIL